MDGQLSKRSVGGAQFRSRTPHSLRENLSTVAWTRRIGESRHSSFFRCAECVGSGVVWRLESSRSWAFCFSAWLLVSLLTT